MLSNATSIMIMIVGFVLISLLYFYVTPICSLYAGEIFPTEVRLRGVGFGNSVSRISAVVTPPIIAVILTNHVRYGVLVVSAFLVLVDVIAGIFGVETRNKPLEEMNNAAVGRAAKAEAS